ncbi:MAG: acetate--CoA ligase [Candidatus Wildermuthbacteria bacterium]|nr:acetate--CoA ligase [Candidatus Wildermuthbacteria bacterium]
MVKKEDLYYPSEEFKKKAWLNDAKIYEEAGNDPVKFWEKLAGTLVWRKKWAKAFECDPPYFKWFLGGKLNITENCLDRNLKDKKDKIALIWEPEPVNEEPRKITYGELFSEVCRLANALKRLGVKRGDRVGIYLPMIPEVIISMLACARIGAVHIVVFSAFSPTALQARLIDSEAKILITADGYYRNGVLINLKNNADAAIKGTAVEKVIAVKRAGNAVSWQEGRDFWWRELIAKEPAECEPEIMDSEDPLFILYTSGSTGKPKGCLHTTGGYAVQSYWTTKWIFDLKDDDIFWSTADIGWITGHTYSCYGPLLCGATFVIFEGLMFFPTPDRWAKIIDAKKATIFYTAPTAIRMLEKTGAEAFKDCKLDTLRLLGSVGEPIDESAWQWYFKNVGKERCPIVDTWWQTETGGILVSSLPGIGPFKPSFAGLPFPGIKVEIKEGNLVILPPFAPGMLRGIYNNPEKYLETYWSQYQNAYFTSDAAIRDENGLIRIIGRVDDVIKVAGHRVSTGELENAINLHPAITESAVVGIPDAIKGEVPVAFVVYPGSGDVEAVKKETIDQIKKEIGPIALPKEVYVVEDLPKTRSGKIMRRILKKLLTNEELGDLSTLSNPETVEKIKAIIGR